MTKPVINRNVDFVNRKTFIVGYIIMISLLRYGIWLFPYDQYYGWTFIHLFHSILSFTSFHWVKGVEDIISINDISTHRSKTWWEQIDNGEQLTRGRKFLTIAPIILFFLCCNETHWSYQPLLWNLLFLTFEIVPKFPFMHRVRLFHINED